MGSIEAAILEDMASNIEDQMEMESRHPGSDRVMDADGHDTGERYDNVKDGEDDSEIVIVMISGRRYRVRVTEIE